MNTSSFVGGQENPCYDSEDDYMSSGMSSHVSSGRCSSTSLPYLVTESDSSHNSSMDDLADIEMSSPIPSIQPIESNVEISTTSSLYRAQDDSDNDSWVTIDSASSDGDDSSATDDLDYLFDDNFSEQSDDSSTVDDDDFRFYQMLTHHMETLSNAAPTFFGMTLQMMYDRIIENLQLEEDKDSPTPQHVLDSLPRIQIDKQQVECNLSCCICFVEYLLDEEILKLPCTHIYHKECILNWLKIRSTCPTCRYDIKDYKPNKNADNALSDTDLHNLQGHFNNDVIQTVRRNSTHLLNHVNTNINNSDENFHTNQQYEINSNENNTNKNIDSNLTDFEPNGTVNIAEGITDSEVKKQDNSEVKKSVRETDIW